MITIAGAGLAGLCSALELTRRGAKVQVFEAAGSIGQSSTARFAGGMLAPWCERASAEEKVITLGKAAADWWAKLTPVTRGGTLVVALPRDGAELSRFARRTSGFCRVDRAEIDDLEPALSGRFQKGLFFENEAHLNPRRALQDLARAVQIQGGEIFRSTPAPAKVDLDCTGIAAGLPDLRPVRGEMAILECPDVQFGRVLRLLHPRIPLYLVPRGDGIFMIGATMVESSSSRPATVRSLSEMLSAAFSLHPAFAEASVIETGAGLRPAFANNLPRLTRQGGTLYLNGLYRHGFLLAPAMAAKAAEQLLSEVRDADHRELKTH